MQREDVQALFFWQTQLVNDKEIRWRDVLDQGHEIGIHSHSHPKLSDLTFEEQFREIHDSKKRLESLTGQVITRFRPPYGLYNEDTMTIAKSLGLDIVLWKVASWDWKHDADGNKIVENVAGNTSPGDIVLLHELPQTVKILQDLIQTLRGKGLQFARPHSPLTLK